MNKNDLFRAFSDVDDDILARSEAAAPRRKKTVFRKWSVIAACMVLAASLFGIALAAEEKEYRKAAAFFEENGLSMEGLSRQEVKEVYRDITTRCFTYGKTAEILEQSVPGFEISQRKSTPEEVAALRKKNAWRHEQSKAMVSYQIERQAKWDENLDREVVEKSILTCYRDSDLLWTAEFNDIYVTDSIFTSAGTAVWGYNDNDRWSGEDPYCCVLARVDESGNILWQRQLDSQGVSFVLDNEDGTWAVLGGADSRYLCLSQYDTDGNKLSSGKADVGEKVIWDVVRLSDGYLVQLGNRLAGETARLVKLDQEGNLIAYFTYEGEDCDYYFTNMMEYGGRVYLSAYAMPKPAGRDRIMEYVRAKENWKIANEESFGFLRDEELTSVVRDNYKAVLLLCNPDGGAAQTFYTVEGSMGGELRVNDAGELAWHVYSVVDTYYSPCTSFFSIGGTCQMFCYTFDEGGTLIRQEETGETKSYLK
ncbi:MAG: hypothetical protein HFE78_06535 [Clostridiales bacterium]|nr:hypothetical protein [Clostridiales bacterium]